MSLLRSLWIFRRANYRDAAPLALKPAFPPDAPPEQKTIAQGREARATLGIASHRTFFPFSILHYALCICLGGEGLG